MEISQSDPIKPLGQAHIALPKRVEQLPPFRQGLGKHGSKMTNIMQEVAYRLNDLIIRYIV